MVRSLVIWSIVLVSPSLALAQYGARPVPGFSSSQGDGQTNGSSPQAGYDSPPAPGQPTLMPPATPPAPGGEADKLTAIGNALEELGKNLTVTTGDPSMKIIFGGAIIADFLYNSARPVAPGIPFFLAPPPAPGFSQNTFDATGRQTTLGAAILGPEVGRFKTGGVVAAVLYSSSLAEDLWGFLPILAYGELKNDNFRFAAGLQFDIFNPLNPNVLPLSYLGASGN